MAGSVEKKLGFLQQYGSRILQGIGAVASAYAVLRAVRSLNGTSSDSWFSYIPGFGSVEKSKQQKVVELQLPDRDTRGAKELIANDLFNKRSLYDLDFDGKRVLMRVDYNVNIKDGVVDDQTRIESTIDSIKYVLNKKGPKGGCKCVVLITHMGRPAGDFDKRDFTLQPVADALQEYLGPDVNVVFLPDCIGSAIEEIIKSCKPGTVFLCENLRFHMEEVGKGVVNGKEVKATTEQIQLFRDKLSRLGDCFVYEAYGAAHRPHSSIVGISIPERVSGLNMHRELEGYGQVLGARRPEHDAPYVVVIGSAMKVTDKIKVIEKMVEHADEMIVTGGMAFTFKKVIDKAIDIGAIGIDLDAIKDVERIVRRAREKGFKIHLPTDHIIASSFSPYSKIGLTDDTIGVPDKWIPLDIGPKSRSLFSGVLARAKTIVWAGTVGCFEWGSFSGGTISILNDICKATQRGCTVVVAGGDASTAARTFYIGNKPASEQVTFVSTGGGSSLVLMEGKLLLAAAHLSSRDNVVGETGIDNNEEEEGTTQ